MSTNYRKLTLRGNTLLAIPESQYTPKQISNVMDQRISDLVFDILMKDAANTDELTLRVAKSYLVDAVAAETLGSLAKLRKLDVIRIVRHMYDCGLAAAKDITELFMGLEIKWTCYPEPAPLPTVLFVIEI